MTCASFVWKNIARNPRRTFLTVISIGLFLFVCSTLMTVLTELKRELGGEDTHLRTTNKTSQRLR